MTSIARITVTWSDDRHLSGFQREVNADTDLFIKVMDAMHGPGMRDPAIIGCLISDPPRGAGGSRHKETLGEQ